MADYGITLDELQKPARTRAAGGKKAGAKKGRPAGKKSSKSKKGAKRTVAPKYRDPQEGVALPVSYAIQSCDRSPSD